MNRSVDDELDDFISRTVDDSTAESVMLLDQVLRPYLKTLQEWAPRSEYNENIVNMCEASAALATSIATNLAKTLIDLKDQEARQRFFNRFMTAMADNLAQYMKDLYSEVNNVNPDPNTKH